MEHRKRHLITVCLTVFTLLVGLLAELPFALPTASAADTSSYPVQAVNFGAYTTNRNLNSTGSSVNTQKSAGTTSENWRIDYVSAGVYQIVSIADGKYLTASGTTCTMANRASDTSQNWRIESVQKDFEGYDLYYRITSVSTGAALTYYQGNNTVGLASYTGDGAQKWKLNLFGLEGFAANSLAGGNEKAGTIGGVLGETVFVSTADELEKQLNSVGPQTIVITADIDMQKKSHTRIRDNKTIIGSYSKNTIYDSQFRTNDTYGAVDDSPSDNIVFRNLNMIAKNVSNRILINIWSSRQIWVDHCTFISYLNSDHTGNGYDEVGKFIWLNTPYKDYLDAKDNGRSPDYITISYNIFRNRFWTVAYGTQNDETTRCRTSLMYNWWDECVRRCPQIGNGTGHIYSNYYSGDDTYVPNSCNQIISGEGSNIVSENCRFQSVAGREIIVQPDTSPYRDSGSYTAKSSTDTPTPLNYKPKTANNWNPQDNYGYTLLDAYNTKGTDTKDFCTKYAGAPSSQYITDSSLSKYVATVYDTPFLTDSFDSEYGNAVKEYTPAVLNEGAVYMIQNVNSGLYLEVDGGKTENGANVQQWGADEPASHNTWRVLSDGDGYYTLYPQIGDKVSYLLDISGNSPDNGTNVGIWSATNADAQRFKFYQASDGIYYLLTKASGDQSCVAVQAASKDSGANVVQWAVNLSDTSQQWKLTQVSDTGCTMDTSKTYMFRNANSGLYMEVANGKAEDNSNVQQWGANEPAAHNSWTLKEFGGGYYYIISQLADGKTYYLNSTGSANGANIEIVTNNKSSSHLFKFVKNPDGTYNILTRTSYDAAAVEVANADRSSGANVQQWTANGNACQKWEVQTCTTTTTATTTTTTTATTTKATTTTTTTKATTTTAKATVTTATQADTTSAKPATTVVTTAATTAAESVPATTETVVSTTVAESATAEKTTSSSTSTTVQTTQTATTTESTLSAKVLYGDANLDGEIDLADAVFLNKAVAGVVSMNDTARANGDCNADGKIDSSDSMVLLKFLVHLVNALPQKSA